MEKKILGGGGGGTKCIMGNVKMVYKMIVSQNSLLASVKVDKFVELSKRQDEGL